MEQVFHLGILASAAFTRWPQFETHPQASGGDSRQKSSMLVTETRAPFGSMLVDFALFHFAPFDLPAVDFMLFEFILLGFIFVSRVARQIA
jgi:hypothetical protein